MAHSKDRMESMIINAKRANLGESPRYNTVRVETLTLSLHNLWDTGRTKKTKDSKDSLNQGELNILIAN